AQAFVAVIESALVFGSDNMDDGEAELGAEKRSAFVQLQAQLACPESSMLDFRHGKPFGRHQRLTKQVLQLEFLLGSLSALRHRSQHFQAALCQRSSLVISEYVHSVVRCHKVKLRGS